MLKGTPQEKRNNAWHKRHLKKLVKEKASHAYRLSQYRLGVPKMKRAEEAYRKALEREKEIVVGFWGRLLLWFKRLFSPIAPYTPPKLMTSNTTSTNA